MPDAFAHAHFGQLVLTRLPESLQKIISANKNEYDMGLLGPDIFFFYRPHRKNPVVEYGREQHRRPACDLFAQVLGDVRKQASASCLIGLVCHYALDSRCHPYIDAQIEAPYDHFRLEAAYDSHLLLKAGFAKPRRIAPSRSLDYEALSLLWPGMDAKTIRQCVILRQACTRLLNRKRLVRVIETLLFRRGMFSCMLLPEEIAPRQKKHMRQLDALFEQALCECPLMIEQIMHAMEQGGSDYSYFQTNYKGESPPVRA